MDIGKFFGITRVINLPERRDRYRQIKRQLNFLGMPFTHGKVELFPAIRVADPAGFPSPGVRGCFLSHLAVLKDARARGLTSVLVLEDDLEVFPEDITLLATLLECSTHVQWDFLYLGHVLALPPAPAQLVAFTGPIQTCHFYAVHSGIFDRVIGYLESCLTRHPGDPIGGPMNIDGALTMFRAANPDVVTLVAQPSAGSQRSSRSDISVRPLEQVPGLRQAMGFARAVRSFIQPSRRASR